ncbi:hypothetical protein Bca4012_047056 [Brassica carinata]|uniref:Uncharacterized protein n=3 Tax=Brassica TaxID=3705 RepID=A0A8X7Q4G7_BRACI|nr:uncharacterized protein LOC111209599 [Brassica napus]KAG2262497.1 hypothetical protein Bca52824_069576 [Brassica carinata]CAF1791655.1 unnamed protein product [Brassica napus]CDY41407.1 BnaCnng10430D [Brassica napus]VDD34695.1 unnamed protein product [Brassica oleracea]
MALRINNVRFLLVVATILVIVIASVAGEAFPDDSQVKQDSAKRDMNWEEVFHADYGVWSPTPIVRRGNPKPILRDITRPPP